MYRHHDNCGRHGGAGWVFLWLLLMAVFAVTLAIAVLRIINYAYKAIRR